VFAVAAVTLGLSATILYRLPTVTQE